MVLVVIETQDGKIRNASLEAVTYGSKSAEVLGTSCGALVLGSCDSVGELGEYGADKVYHIADANLDTFSSKTYADAIAQTVKQAGAKFIVLNHSSAGKSLLGRLAIKLDAGSLAGVVELPEVEGNAVKVRKGVFAGKALADYNLTGDINVITLMGNSLKPEKNAKSGEVENLTFDLRELPLEVVSTDLLDADTVPLPEAELVVSAGRGLKGPENWGIIEDLAKEIGATLACSRPVADAHWRPHHEHVGQTGVAIKPNLYFAIGISGAIQHLAGVNKSKVIVVINKDPEAPFFKAADYGIVGDLFEVVPRLTEALKKYE